MPWPQEDELNGGDRLDLKSAVRHSVTPSAEDQVSTGAGALNDCVIGGTFTGRGVARLKITIDAAAVPDTFAWELKDEDNLILASAAGVAITGASQSLSAGLTVIFGATTGHTSGAIWSRRVFSDAWQARGSYWAEEVRGHRHQQRDDGCEAVIETHGGAAYGAFFTARKANGTRTAQTVVVNNDDLGGVDIEAFDGTSYYRVASIRAEVDGAAGTADLPTRFVFEVAPNAGTTPVEAMRLSQDLSATFAGAVGHAIGTKSDGIIESDVTEVETTDATETSASILSLDDVNAYMVEATVLANGSTGRALYVMRGLFYRSGAGPVQQGTTQMLTQIESAPAWDAKFDISGNTVRVRVTGVAATTIEWASTIKSTNISQT